MHKAAPAPAATNDALWQRQLGLLLESTGEGIFGIDMEGHCTFINRAGARMLGYEAEEVLGLNMHHLTHHSHADGSHYPDTECPIFNAFRKGLSCRIDSEVFWRRDRSAFPVEYSSHPIIDQDVVRGAVITFLDITERKRAADALRQAKDELEARVEQRTAALSMAVGQLRELSAYSEQVREEERTRIAREIHDELGSLLVALKLDVNWLTRRLSEQGQSAAPIQPSPLQTMHEKCANMSRMIEAAVDNVGRIITDLRPSILDHGGLWDALEWQAQEFIQSAEMAMDWQAEISDGLELSEPMTIAVFRIFQEMLSNVGRHANASRIEVTLQATRDRLFLKVADNGCGAHARAFEAGSAYGVMGMRERARHWGGQLEISSTPGQGTTVTLNLPVSERSTA
jgi:PAS domain S-box-containing protein